MATLSIRLQALERITLEIPKRSINSFRGNYIAPVSIDCDDNANTVDFCSMDNQQIFNIIVSVAAFLAVYVFNNMTRQIQKLEDKVNEMPHAYVQKDDYRSDIAEIKSILKQIFEKLDSKADK